MAHQTSRSSITMMAYLARAPSVTGSVRQQQQQRHGTAGRHPPPARTSNGVRREMLNAVIMQDAQRAMAQRQHTKSSKMRPDPEQIDHALRHRVDSLTSLLHSEAEAKAVLLQAEGAMRQRRAATGEEMARKLGVPAPHRPAARGAALSVVGPMRGDFASPQKTLLLPGSASSPLLRAKTEGTVAGAVAGAVARAPRGAGPCLLRSCGGDGTGLVSFVSVGTAQGEGGTAAAPEEKMERVCRVAGAAAGGAAAWQVRPNTTTGLSQFRTPAGGRLHASSAGEIALGRPPRADLALFEVAPLSQAEVQTMGVKAFAAGDGARASAAAEAAEAAAAAAAARPCGSR